MKLRTILGVLLVTVLLALGSATAKDRTNNSGEYLALGDSAVFPYLQGAGYEYFYPTNFVGYADWTGLGLGLNTVNASCLGETTSSYLKIQFSNGCIQYRLLFGLHVDYSSLASTQSDFATDFLEQHSDVALVTIQLGANDLSLLEQECQDNEQYEQCIEDGAPQVFAKAKTNMQTTLAQLRATGYSGPLVIVKLLLGRLHQPVPDRADCRPEPGDHRTRARLRRSGGRRVFGIQGRGICRARQRRYL